jgi:hypothetical protein
MTTVDKRLTKAAHCIFWREFINILCRYQTYERLFLASSGALIGYILLLNQEEFNLMWGRSPHFHIKVSRKAYKKNYPTLIEV